MPVREDNLIGKKFTTKINRKELAQWIDQNHRLIQFIFHIGARTDTTEKDESILKELNLDYSQMLWNKSVEYGFPLVTVIPRAEHGVSIIFEKIDKITIFMQYSHFCKMISTLLSPLLLKYIVYDHYFLDVAKVETHLWLDPPLSLLSFQKLC